MHGLKRNLMRKKQRSPPFSGLHKYTSTTTSIKVFFFLTMVPATLSDIAGHSQGYISVVSQVQSTKEPTCCFGIKANNIHVSLTCNFTYSAPLHNQDVYGSIHGARPQPVDITTAPNSLVRVGILRTRDVPKGRERDALPSGDQSSKTLSMLRSQSSCHQ